MKTIEQFWNNVTMGSPTECWLWQKCANTSGYGRLYLGEVAWSAHRLAYTDKVGPIPDGKIVCHTCDNPLCCNPAHLFLGTDQDNATDRSQKNRSARQKGTTNPANKLTEQQVLDIRAEHAMGISGYKKLGKKYGVHAQTICDIIKRKVWAWL
jgi:hypothetical protein